MAIPEITVAAPPTTEDVAAEILSGMAALSGVVTDFNAGSQVRTISETVGAVVEQQGVINMALALQALAYSAMGAFGILPNVATPGIGTVAFSSAGPVTQAVAIDQGTLVQTAGGIQFVTTEAVVLQAGSTTINVPVQAALGGVTGNVPAGAITQLVSGLTYPLSVNNVAPTAGGANSEAPAQALTRLAAKIASIGLGTPVAVANAPVGVMASGSAETVRFATCYEPWIAAGSGVGSGTAGFDVYIDNGTGAASSGLISAVTAVLNGSQPMNQLGYRPTGVPYGVLAVSPVYAVVAVSGSLNTLGTASVASGAIAAAVSGYFGALPFCESPQFFAYQGAISAAVFNAALGVLTSLSVSLAYASASGLAVSAVSGLPYQRVILQGLTISLTGGS